MKIQVIHRYDHKPERIYDAFLNVEQARKFMFASQKGNMIKAEVQPFVGGAFLFVDAREVGEIEHHGVWLELERPKKLSFTFSLQKDAPGDLVEIQIKPRPKGSEIMLTHEVADRFAKQKDKIAEGWMSILGNLSGAVLLGKS